MNKENQIEEMAKTLDEMCDLDLLADCGEKDCSKCMATALYNAGYRRQREAEWEIVVGSNGRERMVCTNCRHQQDLASTFTYCPNCGARMGGGAE